MSQLLAVAGDGHVFSFTVTPTASTTPVVQVYSDAGRTNLVATCAVTGAGSSWSFTVPTNLPVGTYYLKITASTPGGLATDILDTLLLTSSSISVAAEYFTLDELRALPEMSTMAGNAYRYSDAALTRARGWITALIERYCRTSFVYRTYTDRVDGNGAGSDGSLRLPRHWLRAVTAVTIDGQATFTQSQLDALSVNLAGSVARTRSAFDSYGNAGLDFDGRQLAPWPRGVQNILITSVAGYSTEPPADLKDVALQAARWRAINVDGKSGISSRALSESNATGIVRLSYAGPDRPTGIPDFDATINGWREMTAIPGIA